MEDCEGFLFHYDERKPNFSKGKSRCFQRIINVFPKENFICISQGKSMYFPRKINIFPKANQCILQGKSMYFKRKKNVFPRESPYIFKVWSTVCPFQGKSTKTSKLSKKEHRKSCMRIPVRSALFLLSKDLIESSK